MLHRVGVAASSPLARLAPGTSGRSVEIIRLGPHPSDEAGQFRIGAQVSGRRQKARDLRLGVAGVDRRMANLMQPDGTAAGSTLQFRDQVVQRGFRPGGDRPAAKSARLYIGWCVTGRPGRSEPLPARYAPFYGPVFRKVNRWGQLEHAALGADAALQLLVQRTYWMREAVHGSVPRKPNTGRVEHADTDRVPGRRGRRRLVRPRRGGTEWAHRPPIMPSMVAKRAVA